MVIKIRGRKARLVRIEGEIMELHKPTVFGTSTAIFLPRAFVLAAEAKGEVEGYAMVYNASVLTIRPYYGEGGDNDRH